MASMPCKATCLSCAKQRASRDMKDDLQWSFSAFCGLKPLERPMWVQQRTEGGEVATRGPTDQKSCMVLETEKKHLQLQYWWRGENRENRFQAVTAWRHVTCVDTHLFCQQLIFLHLPVYFSSLCLTVPPLITVQTHRAKNLFPLHEHSLSCRHCRWFCQFSLTSFCLWDMTMAMMEIKHLVQQRCKKSESLSEQGNKDNKLPVVCHRGQGL